MIDELLNLWITRLPQELPADEAFAAANGTELSGALCTEERPRNLIVVDKNLALAREAALGSLRVASHYDLFVSTTRTRGWLAVDVPVPYRVDPTVLIHRMIRRLYFAAVLHGLAEIPVWREAVQSLRLSYLQTRGKVTSSSSETRTAKLGGDLSFSFSLTEPFKAKLTASEEVKLAQGLSATLERLDLYEAEDQLLYDLQILAALDAQIDSYAKFANPRLPRWEHVRGFFKAAYRAVYARLGFGPGERAFSLAPVFVFELHGATAMISALSLLAQAAAVASAQGARVILVGNETLAHAWQADAKLGSPLFRGAFDCYRGHRQIDEHTKLEFDTRQLSFIHDVVNKNEGLSGELRAVLGAMFS